MAIETISALWNEPPNPNVTGLEVVREGARDGTGMVARFTLKGGREVTAISLPNQFFPRTGPTWAYLMDCQGWTLVDAGPRGAMIALEEGLKTLGLTLTDLRRVIITHGHQDHDGNAYDLMKASGAELWAHELYFHFLPFEHRDTGLDRESPLHRALLEVMDSEGEQNRRLPISIDGTLWRDYYRSYTASRRNILKEELPVHAIHDGEELGDLRFIHTPGHTADCICISLNGAVLTGDHVLPQIVPHQTFKRAYPEPILKTIPSEYQVTGDHYGLACYLKSLGKLLRLDRQTTVLPAHLLFSHGRFHIQNLQRAQSIMHHHVRRLEQVMNAVGNGADTPTKVTAEIFPARRLTDGGYIPAISEVVSQLELLADVGDIHVSEDGGITRNGADNFHSAIQAMTSLAATTPPLPYQRPVDVLR